jgi:hypothetical protein
MSDMQSRQRRKTMNKTFLLITIAGVLAVCTSPGMTRTPQGTSPTSICGDNVKKPTDARITYRTKNRFEVSMKLKHDVASNSEFRIELRPDKGSEDALIETIGKSGWLPDGNPTPFDWLNGKGKAADFPRNKMILCVPDGVPIGAVYKFDVKVGGIGSIDPRVHVAN